ncbi:leucine-rich repeat protein [Tanacetum coccineum]
MSAFSFSHFSSCYLWLLVVVALFHLCLSKQNFDDVLCIKEERQALLEFKHRSIDETDRLASWVDEKNDCCKRVGIVCESIPRDLKPLKRSQIALLLGLMRRTTAANQIHLNGHCLSEALPTLNEFEEFSGMPDLADDNDISVAICAISLVRQLLRLDVGTSGFVNSDIVEAAFHISEIDCLQLYLPCSLLAYHPCGVIVSALVLETNSNLRLTGLEAYYLNAVGSLLERGFGPALYQRKQNQTKPQMVSLYVTINFYHIFLSSTKPSLNMVTDSLRSCVKEAEDERVVINVLQDSLSCIHK